MQQADIAALLPEVIRRGVVLGGPLDAVLAVMEALHAPAERALGELEDTFHPYRCEDRFVPFLARWVDVDRFLTNDAHGRPGLPTGVGHLRELVAAAARLSKRQGTSRGLVALLETATGVPGFEVHEEVLDSTGTARPFVISLTVPAPAAAYLDLVRRIVNAEKPAYVVCEIEMPPPSGSPSGSPAPGGEEIGHG
jgi:phage tail-like protein